MKSAKVWGTTTEIFCGQSVELHRILVDKGGFCSKHHHNYKHNLFHVESGCLKIETWRENGIVENTILGPGETTTIPPKLQHRFIALEDTEAVEFYWLELDKNDIVRETQGGILN